MQSLRYYHRWVTIIVAVFVLYLGVTGTIIQMVDLRSILSGAPATDVNVQAMRESFDGPAPYAVRKVADYAAAALPAGFDYPGGLTRSIAAARRTAGTGPIAYLEFRMAGERPVAQAGFNGGFVRFDPANGREIGRVAKEPQDDPSPISTRNTFKRLHRMTTFGNWALTINLVVAIGLALLIVTGTLLWWKLYQGRRKIKRPAVFWKGGGTWRMLHRSISIVAVAFLTVVTLSGAWLAVESAGLAINFAYHPPKQAGGPAHVRPDMALSPAQDLQLPAMLATTMRAARAEAPGDSFKVVRLRTYAGYSQGVVVTGGDRPQQLVFNARTGDGMTTSEPGYPSVPFPFGWHAHQIAKSIHRGDWFGMTGRWIDLLAGVALSYLSLSGIVLYYQMWRKRRDSGRGKLVWK